MWETDGLGSFILKDANKNKYVCCLRPKPTNEYLVFLGKEVFDNWEDFEIWYLSKNYYYGDKSPHELGNQQAIDWLLRIIHGIPI